LLSVEALAETRAALIPLDPALSTFTDPIAPLGTATLGWNAVAYAGHVAYFAPGGWMSSVVALVPAAGVGVGVFTNAYFSERHPFESLFPVYALALVALDSVMEVPPKDWSSVYRAALATVAGPAQ
jgi:hypothetical protein